jgi:hypothetical protein
VSSEATLNSSAVGTKIGHCVGGCRNCSGKRGLVTDDHFYFKCKYVRLLSEDLSNLVEDIRYGKIDDTENDHTLDFCIPAAREAILAGKAVYYWSWF